MKRIDNILQHTILSFCALWAAAVLCPGCNKPSTNEPSISPDEEEEYPLVPGGETVHSLQAVNCVRVARVIGKTTEGEMIPNPNNTPERFRMASTDFGNMWDAGNGSVFCVFGDNFNSYGGDWLSNAIAITTDKDLTDGLYYDSMLWDDSKNKRKEIIHHTDSEATCIPTGGFSVKLADGVRQYINYMSIKNWNENGDADDWRVNYSELVYSDDFGETWIKSGVKWDENSHFAQIAYVEKDGIVYMWGTGAGRHGNAYLARVSPQNVLDKNAYQYWDGAAWNKDESSAAPVTNGEVSEMTVRYNTYYNRYIMMYFSARQRKLVYRDAICPEGEWSAEKIILNGTYGPSIHPWFCDGRNLWFVSSTVTSNPSVNYDTWHIFLYHAYLQEDPEGFNMVWEGGFEYDPGQGIAYNTLWNASLASSSHDAHSGAIACKLTNKESGVWKDACTQTISIHKNTDYVISGYAKGNIAGHTGAYLGVRLADGTILDSNPPLQKDEWVKITKTFNSGDNTSLDIFFGTWGAEGLYVLVDDICLAPTADSFLISD